MDLKKEKILVTGSTGFVGKNLVDKLKLMNCNIIETGNLRSNNIINKYDLTKQRDVFNVFERENPTILIHLAAKVGGIYANSTNKAEFYLQNTLINTNILKEVQERKLKYVFAMGTGCAYPKRLEGQELFEEDFLNGIPESTNDAYAYSKRNMLVHLKAIKESNPDFKYHYCIPANIYGSYDNFDLMNSHVVPALIRKFIEAKVNNNPTVEIWGDGNAKRDFLYIDDLINAMINIIENDNSYGSINVATNYLIKINILAKIIKEIVEYDGEIVYNPLYPNGQISRQFNIRKISNMDWKAVVSLKEGLMKTIEWYKVTFNIR